MSHRRCPLKEAARDAPHLFGELDRLVDQTVIQPQGDKLPTLQSGLPFILQLFASLRRNLSFCPINPRLPPAQIKMQLDLTAKAAPADFLLFTSGSTSTPKLARLSLDNLLANAQGILPTVDLRPGDGWLLSLPLYHVGGLGILFRCILARAQIILDPTSHDITHLSYVPTQLYRAWPIYPKLKCLLLGGAPILQTPPELPIIATYGLTEMSSAVLAQRPVWKNGRLHLGFPLPGREVKLIDNEIFVRGPCLFQGYEGSDKPDWFATRDLAVLDPIEGYAIIGRKDNQFISGGENIQPEEIEQQLLQHPSVLEAVVAPKSDPEFGARPVAFVRAIDARFDLAEMRRFLANRLPKYKIPIALFPLKNDQNQLKINRKLFF